MYEAEHAEEKISALQTNAQAVRAVRNAIEGTIGPKGLDTMLVRPNGDILITNDGVTILEEMQADHPAARMLVHLARGQQNAVGDGTTTATLICAELVLSGVEQAAKGIPIMKIIEGIELGVAAGLKALKEEVRQDSVSDALYKIALIAGRGNKDIANLVVEAAQKVGEEKLMRPHFRLAEQICAQENSLSEVFPGVLITKERMSCEMPTLSKAVNVLVVDDALEMPEIKAETLAVESGVERYLALQSEFVANLKKLRQLNVGLVLTDRNIAPEAEEFFVESGIIALRRVEHQELVAAAEHTGARLIKRTGLKKSCEELAGVIGFADIVKVDEKLQQLRISGGKGENAVTILVGAATRENALERQRIAADAASSVQAAVRSSVVAGGGAVEIALVRSIRNFRKTIAGMSAYGVDCVIAALECPVAQMAKNSGYNPLEKVESLIAAQNQAKSTTIGLNCNNGNLEDMLLNGIIDPLDVKYQALQGAAEVAIAILKIEKIIRAKALGDQCI